MSGRIVREQDNRLSGTLLPNSCGILRRPSATRAALPYQPGTIGKPWLPGSCLHSKEPPQRLLLTSGSRRGAWRRQRTQRSARAAQTQTFVGTADHTQASYGGTRSKQPGYFGGLQNLPPRQLAFLRDQSYLAIHKGLLRSNAIEDSLEEHRVGPLDRDSLGKPSLTDGCTRCTTFPPSSLYFLPTNSAEDRTFFKQSTRHLKMDNADPKLEKNIETLRHCLRELTPAQSLNRRAFSPAEYKKIRKPAATDTQHLRK